MDFIGLHLRFWALDGQQSFTAAETRLYGYLVNLFNSKGSGNKWPESIQLTDGALGFGVNIKDAKTLANARTGLEERGLIRVTYPGKGNRAGQIYALLTSGKTSGKNRQVAPQTSGKNPEFDPEVDPNTSGKNQEVDVPPTEEPTDQPTEEPTEKFPRSIYKEVQTPDVRPQTFFPDASSSAGEQIEKLVSDFEAKKNAGGPTPQPPAPPGSKQPPKPIPIPPGKVYGDGVLQADVLKHYDSYPDQFPLAIYVPFIRYWSSTYQKGDTRKMGMERWRAMDNWDLETRLDNWYQRELKPKHGNAQTTTAAFFDHQRATEPQSGNTYGKF